MQRALTFDSTCDFSRFDTRMKSAPKVEKKEKVKTAAREAAPVKVKPVMSGFAVVAWVVCMVLLFTMVYSYMKLTEATDRANTLKGELEVMREQTKMLEIKKEQKYSSQQLQEIAVNQLGMQKIQKSQIIYVNTNTGDYTEVAQSKKSGLGDSAILTGLSNGFNSFIEYIN